MPYIDEDELAMLQFSTPFMWVPFSETPRAKAAFTVTNSEGRGVARQVRFQTGAKDVTSTILLSGRQSGEPPPRPPQSLRISETQHDEKALREDATAANWSSHLLIQVGTDTSHITLEAENLDNNCDQIVCNPLELIYYGCKE